MAIASLGVSVMFATVKASAQNTPRRPASPVLTTETIAARAIPGTVTILTFDAADDTLGFGSGFIVRSSGVVVTNHHVMAGAFRAVVILSSGEQYDRVEAIDTDSISDLAILKIPGHGLPVLPTSSTLPNVGAKLVAIGNPLGLSHTVTEGILSAIRLVEGRQLLQMSVPISPGSSGGPVLNNQGRAVAVATAYLRGGQNLNFAVPVWYALGLVDVNRPAVPLAQIFGGSPGESVFVSSSDRRDVANYPGRTARPRRSIAGTYSVFETTNALAADGSVIETYTRRGVLLLGQSDQGFYVVRPDDTTDSSVGVFGIASTTATEDGRLAVRMGGVDFEGYQTESGLYLEGDHVGREQMRHLRYHVTAEPLELPLSSPSGLYRMSVRTWFVSNQHGRGDHPTDWEGEMALAYAKDSVYVSVELGNSAGGSTGVYLAGPMTGDHFALSDSDGNKITGSFAAGRLHGDWYDQRDGAHYEGRYEARRR